MDPQAKCLKVKLFSEANTGYFYTWKKNPKAYPWRIALRKYDPIVRRHVLFKVRVFVCRGYAPGGRRRRVSAAYAAHAAPTAHAVPAVTDDCAIAVALRSAKVG